MEVISRINAFLGIMFIVLIVDHLSVSSFTDGDSVGQAFNVEGFGEIKENHKLKVTEDMKTLITIANKKYLAGDIIGAETNFNKLMKLRVEDGGKLSIREFTKLLPEPTGMVFRKDDKSRVGFFILSEKGELIAEEIKDIIRVITYQDAVFKTIFYIFYPEESFAIIYPDKRKIKIHDKFYYPDMDDQYDNGFLVAQFYS